MIGRALPCVPLHAIPSQVSDWRVVHLRLRDWPWVRCGIQALATPRQVGPGGVSDVTRPEVVTATAIATTTGNTSWQVPEGMVRFTMPCVARTLARPPAPRRLMLRGVSGRCARLRILPVRSARHGPGIDHRQACGIEGARVARCHGEPMRNSDRRDVAIGRGESLSSRARLDGEIGIAPR